MLDYTKTFDGGYILRKDGKDYLELSVDKNNNLLEINYIGTTLVDGKLISADPYQDPNYQAIRAIPGFDQFYMYFYGYSQMPEVTLGLQVHGYMVTKSTMDKLAKILDIPADVAEQLYKALDTDISDNYRVSGQLENIDELIAKKDYTAALRTAQNYIIYHQEEAHVVLYKAIQQIAEQGSVEDAFAAYCSSITAPGVSIYASQGARYVCQQELAKDIDAGRRAQLQLYLDVVEQVEIYINVEESLMYHDEDLLERIYDSFEQKHPQSYYKLMTMQFISPTDLPQIGAALADLTAVALELGSDKDLLSRDNLSALDDFIIAAEPAAYVGPCRTDSMMLSQFKGVTINQDDYAVDSEQAEEVELEPSAATIACRM